MKGLEISELKKTTHEILDSGETHIGLSKEKIPIPRPNPIMQAIISLLKTKGIDVYIVTASNQVSAEIICWKYFGIPSSNVFGITILTDRKEIFILGTSEVPFAEGKVTVLKRIFKDKPIVTGGDSLWDKYLLDYTTLNGIRFWVGQDKNEFKKLKDEFYLDVGFFNIPRE